jgi:iron complex outermembrane recepter protein
MNLRVRGRSRVIEVLLVAALAVARTMPAFATETHQFDVPAEDAPTAIRDFASQAHVQILVAGENVKEKSLHTVSGEFSTEQGLRLLLADSGLSPQYVGDRSIALVVASDSSPLPEGTAQEGKNSSSGGFRVAQVDQGKTSRTISVGNQSSSSSENSNSLSTGISEIIVTAQKREERLQDVPIPVTALSADQLVAANQLRIEDYYSSVPGLNFVESSSGSAQLLSIRGITTGFANPTTGVTVDDVPFGSSTGQGGSQVVPDIDPGDLARIEVLRGPQGTLYGASSMGGLLKFVTVNPSTDSLSGQVQAGLSGVENSDGIGYNVRGSANVPLSDTMAVRISAFHREDPGYIDNPVIPVNGINEAKVNGGRLAGLWRPSGDFSIKVSALLQDTKGGGSSDVDVLPSLGDLQQNYPRNVGEYERKLQAYSATLTGKLGAAELVAVTGYNVNAFTDSVDYSSILGGATPLYEDNRTKKLSQEIRLSMPIGQRIDWLVGAFYTHENSQFVQSAMGENPATGALLGTLLNINFPSTFEEYAAFTDLTFHFTDRFNVQLGGRESEIRQASDQQSETGSLLGGTTILTPQANSRANAFTYLVTPQFKVSSDVMAYIRLASGYRAGGPNAAVGVGVPPQYNPDKTENYEIGLKADFLEHKLSIDASLYYIDWKNIQLTLLDQSVHLNYTGNGAGAKSQGAEFSVESRPLTGLKIGAWVSFDQAVLTQDLPSQNTATTTVYGVDGDRLPLSSRFSGNISLQQDFPLTNLMHGFVGGAVSYVGNREGTFQPTPVRQNYPAYAKTDLRAGVVCQFLTVNLYANNITDRRGVLAGGLGTIPDYAFTFIQPRTVGLNAIARF